MYLYRLLPLLVWSDRLAGVAFANCASQCICTQLVFDVLAVHAARVKQYIYCIYLDRNAFQLARDSPGKIAKGTATL